jgi:protein SCO1/2
MVFSRSIVSLAILTLAGCASRPELPTLGATAPFELTEQSNQKFDSAVLQGKVWVADFMFTTCPGPCPRMSSQMHQVQTAFAGNDNVRFVSFTVDPANDTPPVLAAYAKHFEAIPGKWFFLTGPVPELNRLSRATFNLGNVDGSLEHSTRFVLIDATSQIRGYYQTSEKDAISNLIADVKSLLKEQI